MSFEKEKVIGFIGLGVMGEPICRNLAIKSQLKVIAFDLNPAPLERLAMAGVEKGKDIADVVSQCDFVFLSLPSGEVVDQIARQNKGILTCARQGQVVIDLSTSPVQTTRMLAADFERKGAVFIDAPVARTRAAAEAGTLAVMMGATQDMFERLRPLISTFATDISLCGPVGCGQVLKILNNMVLFETVVAISEAKAIAEKAGVRPSVLFETLSKGSADSFALRNHGMKAIMTGEFPEKAFSVHYARKDLRYALELAGETQVQAHGAQVVDAWFERAIQHGDGEKYHPVISEWIANSEK